MTGVDWRPVQDSDAGVSAGVDDIDAVLPQTQCRQCGFDGCRPYAAAIADGRADINQCPPGGEPGVAKIAAVVGRAPLPLDPTRGATKPFAVAVIDEAICIGCTLCIQACPVDAIVGGAKRMHDVVADLCSGCELCIAPCPVDCIAMVPAAFAWDAMHADAARLRHAARATRLLRIRSAASRALDNAIATVATRDASSTPTTRKQAIVAAAVERAQRLRRQRLDARSRAGTP